MYNYEYSPSLINKLVIVEKGFCVVFMCFLECVLPYKHTSLKTAQNKSIILRMFVILVPFDDDGKESTSSLNESKRFHFFI